MRGVGPRSSLDDRRITPRIDSIRSPLMGVRSPISTNFDRVHPDLVVFPRHAQGRARRRSSGGLSPYCRRAGKQAAPFAHRRIPASAAGRPRQGWAPVRAGSQMHRRRGRRPRAGTCVGWLGLALVRKMAGWPRLCVADRLCVVPVHARHLQRPSIDSCPHSIRAHQPTNIAHRTGSRSA